MPDRTLYANVAFKRGGKKVFTYRIPSELWDQVLPGSGFGPRFETGTWSVL
jgi:hypothetical protein